MGRNALIAMTMFFFGCGKNYSLSKSDLRWNPYKGGEVLVFKSNQGDTDTIYVRIIEKAKTDDDPLAASPNKREVLNVVVKHTNPTPTNSKDQMEDSFLELYAARDKNTLIDFDLMAKNSWFYGESFYINDLNRLKESTLDINGNIYKDVVVIEPQEKIRNEYYDEREEFVTKIYWSKSKGYIRYDLKNGVFWELQ